MCQWSKCFYLNKWYNWDTVFLDFQDKSVDVYSLKWRFLFAEKKMFIHNKSLHNVNKSLQEYQYESKHVICSSILTLYGFSFVDTAWMSLGNPFAGASIAMFYLILHLSIKFFIYNKVLHLRLDTIVRDLTNNILVITPIKFHTPTLSG